MAYRREDGQVIVTTEDVRKGGFEVVPEPYNTQMNAGPIDNSDTGAQLDEAFRNSNSFLAEAYRKYTYNKADWAADADIYGKKLNISPDVLLNGGTDLIEKARKISSDMDRVGDSIEMNTMYPELQNIKFASEAEAVTLLNNAKSVRSSYGVWDALQQGVWSMNDQMKMADAGYQLAYTNDVAKREELFKEIERLQSNINQYRTTGSTLLETVVGETAQQAYMMGKEIVRGAVKRGAEGMALGTATGAGIGTVFAGVGAVPGAVAGGITGLSTGIKVGTAEQMQHMSFGLKYLDLINKKDSKGKRIYTDEEARNRATAYSIVDTGIEYASLRVAGKAIKAAVPGSSALSKIMASEGLSETFRRGGLAVARNYVKTGIKTGGAELIEEGLQDINDKLQTNLFGKVGDDVYSVRDIGLGAIQAMVDASPAVLGLGILGGLGGGIHTASQFRAFNRMSPEQQQMVVQSEINARGNKVLQAMVADGETNILAKNNPELYSKVIQAAADKRGIGQVYINVQDMINTEQGQVAVQNMVQNGYMTQEEVTKAIENDTSIEVPISQFAQANIKLEESTLKELENHVYYTEGGMSLHGIQKAVNTAKAMREHFSGEYAAKQDAVRHEIMKEFSENTDIEKEMADLVVGNNPYAIKRSFNELYNALEEEYKETYHDELTTPAISESEQDAESTAIERPRFITTSIGDVKAHTKMGARRLAFNQAKNRVMENFTEGMSEGAQKVALARYEEMEGKLQRLEVMDKIKDRLFTIAEGDVYVRSNLSPDGYEVYQSMVNTLKQGNVSMVKSAKENALVFATHADVVANIMQRAGYREYTAKDYVEQYIKVNARDVTPVEGGYGQDVKEEEKQLVQIPLKFDINSGRNNKVNVIKTAFIRENVEWYENALKNNDLLFMTKKGEALLNGIGQSGPKRWSTASLINYSIKQEKDLRNLKEEYLDTKKITDWYSLNRLQLPSTEYQISDYFDYSIPNETDLRNLKEENPTYYQKGNQGVSKEVQANANVPIGRGYTQADVKLAKERLKEDTKQWHKIIDNLETYHERAEVRVMTTPLALQLAGAKPYEMKMGISKIRKVMQKHEEITKEGLKNIIQQLADPIAVFKSKTEPNSIVAIINLKYPVNNSNVIVPIKLDANNQTETYQVNVITSAYAKYNLDTLNPSVKWYTDRFEGKAEQALYLNTKKITDWYSLNRLQLPSTKYQISDFNHSIPNDTDLRNRKEEYLDTKKITDRYSLNRLQLPSTEYQISDYFNYSIPNETDLRNFKEENPTYYQEGDQRVSKEVQGKYIVLPQKFKAGEVKGLTSMYEDGRRLVQLFESADFSTFIHESGHVFLEDLRMLATMDGAPEDVIADWNRIKKWTGYEEGADADTNRAAHEKFARGFEAYLREGKAPTKLLERTFRRFKQWLTAIYYSVTSLGGLPPKKVQDVMARMLAVQSEIDSYTAQQGLDSFERSKIYSGMAGEEQAQFMVRIDDVREGAKEKVLKAYMKELDGRAEKVWEEQKETIRRDLKEYYVERYPVYAARVIYENFGEAGLINTDYKTVNELEMGEAQALGDWHELIEQEMQTAKESLTETYVDPTEIKKMADEYLLSNEGQQKVAMAEAEAVKKFTNRSIAANYEVIATLNTMEVITPEAIQSIVKAIEKKADKSTVRKVKSVAKKYFAEPNNNIANEKVVNALKDALQEYISNMRALRNLSVGDVDTMMEKAHDSLKRLPVSKAVSFKQYQNKSVTSARLADIALAKGKMDEAFYHKQQQLFMQAMARAAYENAEEQRKLEQDLKKKYTAISRPKNPKRIKPEARYFIGHLLYQMGIVNRDATLPSEGFTLESIYSLLDTDVELMQQEGSIKLEQWIIDVFNQGKKWNKLTFEELGNLYQIVVAVYTRGLSEYESTTLLDEKGKLVTFDEAVVQMIEQGQQRLTIPSKDLLTLDNEKGKVGATKNKITTLMMDLIKPEVILRRFDDDKVGPWVRYVYDPIDRATRKGKEMFEVATRRLSTTLGIYSKKELYYLRTERMYNMGAVYSMTKEQVIALALNWGTKNNRQRVRETLQIENDVEVERYFSQYLDNKDWDFIESVWDFINSYYEERSAVQERLYGTPLHKVRTLDFTINGRKIKGQYYPIVYDPRMDGNSKGYEVEDIIRSQMSSNAVWGMGMSATKNRVQQVKGRKLMLSFDVIPRAIDEAINHIAMREAAIDVNKLLSQQELANYIISATDVETLQLLKKWVRDNWQAEIVRTTKWDRYLQTVKSNTTFSIMAYRTSTALLNILNIVPMMYEQGIRKSLMAIGRFYLHVSPEKIKQNREFVEKHSVFIRERRYNLDKDMKEGLKVGQDGITYFANDDIGRKISEGKQAFEDTRDWINNYGYSFITETDLLLSMPLWKMVYDEKIAEYLDDESLSVEFIESKAVSEADRAVRRVFGSGETKDAAAIQRSRNSITALFTPFYTYANTVFNALVEGGYVAYDKRDYGKLFNVILYWVLIQGLAEGTLRAMMDDEEDDMFSWFKKVGSATVSGGLGGLPYIRDVFGLVYNLAVGEPSYSRGNETVALSVIPKVVDLSRIMSKESSSWIDVMRTGGQITNRFIGFSDTLSDGFWTLAKWSLMDTDASVTDLMKAIIFDRKIKTKEEQRQSKK